jgi:hypothetical protein
MSEQSSWFKKSAGKFCPSVTFEEIGATIVGTIIDEPRILVTKDDDNKDVENLIVNLETMPGTKIRTGKKGERVDVMPGDQVSVWLKPGQIARAVAEALSVAKADGLAEGGTLAIQYYAVGPQPANPKLSPPKLYNCEYKAPVNTVSIGAGLLTGAGAARDDNAPF